MHTLLLNYFPSSLLLAATLAMGGPVQATPLPIELISINSEGNQATRSFGSSRGDATNGVSGISHDGSRVAYTTRDRAFALDLQATASTFYSQIMQWRRGQPGSVKALQPPSGGIVTSDFVVFDKLRADFCFYSVFVDFVTADPDAYSNYYCKQADGSYQYAGVSGPDNRVPRASRSFNGPPNWDVFKFEYELDPLGGSTLGMQVAVRDRQTGVMEFVSVNTDGVLSSTPHPDNVTHWIYSEISNDGRFVLFDSPAGNLVTGDEGLSFGQVDLFVRDRVLRATQRIEPDDGLEFTGEIRDFDLSRDGRYAVFVAAGYMSKDCATLPGVHVYLYELATRRLECISRDSNGQLSANDPLYGRRLQISDDARFVVYTTGAGLDPRDTNNLPDVYLYDLIKRRAVLISDTHDGQVGNDWSSTGLISGDGNWVVFRSFADNLVTNDRNGRISDIFVRDLRPLRQGAPALQLPAMSMLNLLLLAMLTIGIGALSAAGRLD